MFLNNCSYYIIFKIPNKSVINITAFNLRLSYISFDL
jgi:hypothetical protein